MMEIKIQDIVYNFPTQEKIGFTSEEIDTLLMKHFPSVKREDLNKAIGVVTAALVDGKTRIYHSDIYYALRECTLGKKPNIFEFD